MPADQQYFRIMLGKKSAFFESCLKEGYIGVDFGIRQDFSHLPEDKQEFNKEFIPVYFKHHPEKSRYSAGAAFGALHTVCREIDAGDIVFSPDGKGSYAVGKIESDYFYSPESDIPHGRKIRWNPKRILKTEMSEQLQRSMGTYRTVLNISKYWEEIDLLIEGQRPDDAVKDPTTFAMERHLENFLVANWQSCELEARYDILREDDELIGQQYPTDTGPIDILAISKDRSELLVVELKRGKASDKAVGQVQRYMGYLRDEVAEENQKVKGCIIALEDDLRIRRALRVNPLIDFYRYEVSFNLKRVEIDT